MDAPVLLWQGWKRQVKELFPRLHGHQKTGLALLVIGIVLAGSAVLQRVAEELSGRGRSLAKMTSIERRLVRLIANDRIVVSQVWADFLAQVLPFWRGKELSFVLDATPFREDATIVYVGLLAHRRVLPLAWAVMPAQEQWQERQWVIVARLLDQVAGHVRQMECTLLADRGLVGAPLVKLCRERGWHYLLRVCKDHPCRRKMGKQWSWWTRFDSFVRQPGQQWYGRALVWQEETIETFVSACWSAGQEQAWVLISDQAAGKGRLSAYAKRMRVEATFQDSKSQGFNIEASWVHDLARLERLLSALFLAMWWTCHLAASCMHHGERHRFDRQDRRDKGMFRLGRLWLIDILRRAPNEGAVLSCLPFTRRNQGLRFSLRF